MYTGRIKVKQVHQHQTLKVQLTSISNKVPIDKKPKKFIHSNKVLRNKNFRSRNKLFISLRHLPHSPNTPHETMGITLQITPL